MQTRIIVKYCIKITLDEDLSDIPETADTKVRYTTDNQVFKIS